MITSILIGMGWGFLVLIVSAIIGIAYLFIEDYFDEDFAGIFLAVIAALLIGGLVGGLNHYSKLTIDISSQVE